MRYLIFILFFALLASSCKTRKKSVQAKPRNMDTSVFVNQTNGKDSLLRQKWQYFSSRIGIDYYGPDNELSGIISLRMRKDSIIWFSASAAIGIQVMKGIITHDSVKILDIFNKKYRAYSISELGKQFGADIGLRELQNILIGNPVFDTLVYGKGDNQKGWLAVSAPVTNLIFCQDFHLPDSSFLAQKGTMRQLKSMYKGTMSAGSYNIAQQMVIFAFGASNNVRMDLEFKTATDAVIPSYPFDVPKDYEHVNNE